MEQVKDWTLALIVREVLKGANIEEIQRRKKSPEDLKFIQDFGEKVKNKTYDLCKKKSRMENGNETRFKPFY